jgi:hypothetical protein
MRKVLLGLAVAAIGLGASGAAPAQAQGFSITVGTPGYYGPPAPVYSPYPRYRPVYYRPAYPRYPAYVPAYYGPRCTTEVSRYWDGWGWVNRRHRVCD